MKIANAPAEQESLLGADPVHLQALEALYDVIDPELGINIVDLGLVYELDVRAGTAHIAMTMTTPACPLHDYLAAEVTTAIRRAVPAVTAVDVQLVWDPPWDPSHMSDAAKDYLAW